MHWPDLDRGSAGVRPLGGEHACMLHLLTSESLSTWPHAQSGGAPGQFLIHL